LKRARFCRQSAVRRAAAGAADKSPGGGAERLRCDGCPDMEFATREELVTHRRVSHSMLTCDLCDKFYGRTSHLWKHVNRLHPGHPAITCSYCGKISASRAQLKAHVIKMHRAGGGLGAAAAAVVAAADPKGQKVGAHSGHFHSNGSKPQYLGYQGRAIWLLGKRK